MEADSCQIVMAIEGEVQTSTDAALWAYLSGASRDGTFNREHRTWRISQRGTEWLVVLRSILKVLGKKSWIYREGIREVFTLETTARIQPSAVVGDRSEIAAFVRGYFDAEGGIPREPGARFYIQFVQRNKLDLAQVREHAISLGLACGSLHNPSVTVDPQYWRFYVRSASTPAFLDVIGSWHPRKRRLLHARRQALVRERSDTPPINERPTRNA